MRTEFENGRASFLSDIDDQLQMINSMIEEDVPLRNDLAAMGFPQFQYQSDLLQDTLRRFNNIDKDKILRVDLEKLAQFWSNLRNDVQQIKDYPPNEGNTTSERQRLLDTWPRAFELRIEALDIVISKYEARTARAIESELKARFQELIDQNLEGVRAASEAIRADHGELSGILKTAKDNSAQLAVVQHEKTFKRLANWHTGLSIGFGCLAFVAGWFLVNAVNTQVSDSTIDLAKSNPSLPQSIYLIHAVRGSLLPILLGLAIFYLLKLMVVERHNAIVNRHREKALGTFAAMVASAVRPDVREAVLLQTTSAIFAHQPTGLSKSPIEVQSIPWGILGSVKTEGG